MQAIKHECSERVGEESDFCFIDRKNNNLLLDTDLGKQTLPTISFGKRFSD